MEEGSAASSSDDRRQVRKTSRTTQKTLRIAVISRIVSDAWFRGQMEGGMCTANGNVSIAIPIAAIGAEAAALEEDHIGEDEDDLWDADGKKDVSPGQFWCHFGESRVVLDRLILLQKSIAVLVLIAQASSEGKRKYAGCYGL